MRVVRSASSLAQTRGGANPIAVGAAVFFLMAVMLAAAPAFRSGAAALAGLLLLSGLAGVAFIGLMAVRALRDEQAEAPEPAALVAALSEPVALVRRDGAIVAASAAWSELMGGGARLPKAANPALRAASASADGRCEFIVDQRRVTFWARTVASARLLCRAAPADRDAGASARYPSAGLEPLAAASPFGAALIAGDDAIGGRIVEANAALAVIAGPKAAAGASLGEFLESVSAAEARAQMEAGRAGPFEVALAGEGHRVAHLYVAPVEGGRFAYLVDITAHKELQRQLNQRNKMEAIGQLAGGVAHDFNNLLSAMRLRIDELLTLHPLGDPSFDSLTETRDTILRAADLVNQLLTFSRKATVQRQVLEPAEVLGALEILLRRLVRENIGLETEYGRDLPLVLADQAQLDNAILNLVVNAKDAIRSGAGHGTIRLRASRVTDAEARHLGYEGPPAGDDLAMIEVADDGPGIPPEVIGKIFEPFFTTKGVGEGTGLGLATVYGIVKQANGWIAVHSEPGEGTAFRIFLPAYQPPLRVEPVAPPPARPQRPRDLSGAGRILFVEDEASVRGIAARLLRARGYEVLEAADGLEALEMARANAGAIDLMISDVIMPGMDGPTLLKEARPYLGAAPVMFISGYAEAEFSAVLEGESGVSFLPKPIDIRTLSERVKQQLQAA
ncbi:MAG TPA: ATP-binding protein [Caulobacteraceae bacterium]|nr:ATP-binding protein [Caulobacteraceae bacterium]